MKTKESHVKIYLQENDDFSYLKRLVMVQNPEYLLGISDEDFKERIVCYWVATYKDVPFGCAFISLVDGIFLFDAYKDHGAPLKVPISASIEVGKFILDTVNDSLVEIFSFHKESDRLSTMALIKLGFEIKKEMWYHDNKYILFYKKLNGENSYGC